MLVLDLESELRCSPDLRARALADVVVAALIDEATLTPKPGLVDMSSRGAHTDLTWNLMCTSASALHHSFSAMAQAGLVMDDNAQLRHHIGHLGRLGEACMMQATGGVNTHRGAIWALGLLVTAAARDLFKLAPIQVAQRAAQLARIVDSQAPAQATNKGALACLTYQVGGARVQAQQGFPLVIEAALPALRAARGRGQDETTARLDALLSVMALLDDTCVLSRGGWSALDAVQRGAAWVLGLGGCSTAAGKVAYREFGQQLLRLNVSPGGGADMLAAALFLDRLEKNEVVGRISKA